MPSSNGGDGVSTLWYQSTGQRQKQDVDVCEVLDMAHALKVRYRVHYDGSYRFQSYAHADVWCADDLSWHRVADVLPEQVADPLSVDMIDRIREMVVDILL